MCTAARLQSAAIELSLNTQRLIRRPSYHLDVTMRYAMKQKLFCSGDDYRILDESGIDVFLVDGKAFVLFGKRLLFLDMDGRELAEIRQRSLAWGPTYEIVREGRVAATVSKQLFTLVSCKFTVDVPGPDDLEATGNLFDYEYTFKRHGREVARVSRKFFTWTDSYGVDIAEGEDDVVILASTVVIDLCCHGENRA
jgi:uncharacterized protein YxjI